MQRAQLIELPAVSVDIERKPDAELPLDLEALLENFVFPFATADVLFAPLPPFSRLPSS